MDQPSTTSSSAADGLSLLLEWINSTDGLQGWTTDGLTTTLDGLQGWTATTDGLDDGPSTSALDDGSSTSALDDELSTASALPSLQGSTATSTQDDELSLTHTTLPTLNLSGLSDILDELAAALEDDAAPKTSFKKGSGLSDQLKDEPGLLETLKELGFQETATGKDCCHMQ